jgi:hypothetical protein
VSPARRRARIGEALEISRQSAWERFSGDEQLLR